jgi:hypothetical protein
MKIDTKKKIRKNSHIVFQEPGAIEKTERYMGALLAELI